MSDTTSTSRPSTPGPPPGAPGRRFLRRAAIVTAVAGVATALGLAAYGPARGHGCWHRGGFLGAALDPATMDRRLDRMLEHLYVEIDATEAQQAAIAPIVKGAIQDLLPVRTRMLEARRQAVTLLSGETIDRGALETLRAEKLALAEQASRRLVQALGDLAEVLTSEQRRELAERIGRWHGPRG